MDITALMVIEITLGCFINLHKKVSFIDNVIFADINNY